MKYVFENAQPDELEYIFSLQPWVQNPMHPFLTIVYLYQNPMRGVCTHF